MQITCDGRSMFEQRTTFRHNIPAVTAGVQAGYRVAPQNDSCSLR